MLRGAGPELTSAAESQFRFVWFAGILGEPKTGHDQDNKRKQSFERPAERSGKLSEKRESFRLRCPTGTVPGSLHPRI